MQRLYITSLHQKDMIIKFLLKIKITILSFILILIIGQKFFFQIKLND